MTTKEPSQEQIDALIAAIDRIERRRKIMLAGYLLSVVLLVGGQVMAFYLYAVADQGPAFAWVFLIPFSLVGLTLWAFGRIARGRVRPPPAAPAAAPPPTKPERRPKRD